jgi:hypothetical protein
MAVDGALAVLRRGQQEAGVMQIRKAGVCGSRTQLLHDSMVCLDCMRIKPAYAA